MFHCETKPWKTPDGRELYPPRFQEEKKGIFDHRHLLWENCSHFLRDISGFK